MFKFISLWWFEFRILFWENQEKRIFIGEEAGVIIPQNFYEMRPVSEGEPKDNRLSLAIALIGTAAVIATVASFDSWMVRLPLNGFHHWMFGGSALLCIIATTVCFCSPVDRDLL